MKKRIQKKEESEMIHFIHLYLVIMMILMERKKRSHHSPSLFSNRSIIINQNRRIAIYPPSLNEKKILEYGKSTRNEKNAREIKKPNQNRKKIEQNEFIENGGVKKKK